MSCDHLVPESARLVNIRQEMALQGKEAELFIGSVMENDQSFSLTRERRSELAGDYTEVYQNRLRSIGGLEVYAWGQRTFRDLRLQSAGVWVCVGEKQ